MTRLYFILTSSLTLTLAGCTAPVGSSLKVPEDAGNTCSDHCQSIGMRLTAVAIMANNVGCVCEPGASNAEDDPGSMYKQTSASAGGMTAIAIQQEEERRQAGQNGALAGAAR